MPEHGHGMMTDPSTVLQVDGSYKTTGMLHGDDEALAAEKVAKEAFSENGIRLTSSEIDAIFESLEL